MKPILILICLSSVLLVSNTAAAKKFKCPATPKQEQVAVKKAGKYFAAGEKFAKKEMYLKALDRYLCSLKMKAHSNTMFNIAQVSKLVTAKEPAVQRLKNFRNRNPKHPSVNELNQLIARMEGPPPGDNTEEQSENPSVQPAEEMPPEPETETEVKTVDNTESAEASVLAATIDEETLPAQESSQVEPSPHAPNKLKIGGIALIIGGGAFMAMGIGMSAGASVMKDNALAANTYNDFDQYEQKHSGLVAGAVVGFLIGTACLTTGIILLIKSKQPKKAQRQSALFRWQPNIASTGLTFSF